MKRQKFENEKICSKCGIKKLKSCFFKQVKSPDGFNYTCKDCGRANSREYCRRMRIENPEKLRMWSRNFRKNHPKKDKEYGERERSKLRNDIINGYGGKCVCCGEKEIKFLCIDHVIGKGNIERKLHGGSSPIFRRLRRGNYEDKNYQILCHNCNLAKGFYGKCPHKN